VDEPAAQRHVVPGATGAKLRPSGASRPGLRKPRTKRVGGNYRQIRAVSLKSSR